MVLMNWLTR